MIYLDPFPSKEDFDAMYPPSYQNGIDTTILTNENIKLKGLRYAYKKHFDLLQLFSPGKRILDYGCGNGNFVFNALNKGYDCIGAEYNPEHVQLLIKEGKGDAFYSIDQLMKNKELKFDTIRLSNVLEHLTDPRETITTLISKLNPNGILLIEGPIETNPSFAHLFRKIYFKLRKNKTASHPPTHIFFSNKKNQRNFFKGFPLQEIQFKIAENEWPFPEHLKEIKNASDCFKYLIAKTSKLLAALSKNQGNTFIYAGKKISA